MVQLNGPFIILFSVICARAFPSYMSLAGLSERQLEEALSTLEPRVPSPPPGPEEDQGPRLVVDPAHPFLAPVPGDQRGPCPGLNTLANHGYIPRDGVASPSQIISASMAGFNMDHGTARLATYVGHILNGNVVTDLLSIGGKTDKTGPDPPPPASVGGINTHGTVEGDSSLTRGKFCGCASQLADDFFGNNFNFNQEFFNQFTEFSARYGNGYYNLTVAHELRYHRIQQSINSNPTFNFLGPRQITAFGESAFPILMFVDGRTTGALAGHLSMSAAESFFKDGRYPPNFFRAANPGGAFNPEVLTIVGTNSSRPGFQPGRNANGVNTFVVDDTQGGLSDICRFYEVLVGTRVKALYPNPTGVLRSNLNLNLQFLFDSLPAALNCRQIFPYGSD
ncbi:Cloroperoxidase [Coprinopsis marcescibilis]|uniref:Cloroperoxidase n=1 Tax=Coprinopsis marcescibilis TaxID=230819 RepID=A0A5C3KEW4_COPMA|nr:Cloroperoxidase [Coprinopsis marcescibilis]